MKRTFPYIILAILFSVTLAHGQISPGELSQAHAKLEGMSNCTQCHDLGSKVSDKKCLECHTEIQSLIKRKKGYHAAAEVRNKDCFSCHSDHHGRKFDMVRFDEDAFNHDLTGYELEGQHGVIDCKKCHAPENIADAEIRKRPNTFLGMDQKCLSCHDDFHQGTLSNDCISCHDIEAFRPAPKFDHDKADFTLKGEHATVDCIECHKMTTRKGKEFQEFNDIPFADCVACHEDPHLDRIEGKCAQCHTETSFATFVGKGKFDHNTTNFTLKGSHNKVDCFSCHAKRSDPTTVFQDKSNISENSCVKCHEDFHKGKYGTDCAKCHTEQSFLSLKSMDFFDHTKTDYPLEGKHQSVDCKQCHVKRFSTPIDFSACNKCHEDYHEGEFAENGRSPDCVTCHSLEEGFDYSLYTLEQHQETKFPLEGAHVATPCFACHVSEKEDRWTFREIGSACVDCHEDIHKGYISAKFYPQNACTDCHESDAWSAVTFDHNRTDWPLEGKHQTVGCRDCHFEVDASQRMVKQAFNTLDQACVTCHENVHGEEFAIDGVTDCKRCHDTESWFPNKFDHSTTDFPLEGRHAEIACSACHVTEGPYGQPVVVYKIEKFECIDCHR